MELGMFINKWDLNRADEVFEQYTKFDNSETKPDYEVNLKGIELKKPTFPKVVKPPKHLVEEAENQIEQEKETVGRMNNDNILWEIPEWQVSGVPPDFINVFSERKELLEKAI